MRQIILDVLISLLDACWLRKGVKWKHRNRIEKVVRTYKNINTTPAARIRRVVLDQPARPADFMYSHASSMVISPAEEAMIAIIMALRR